MHNGTIYMLNEQCLILLGIMHNYAIHNTHLMHSIVILCTCAHIFHFWNNYAQIVVHLLYIKWKIVNKCPIPQQTCTMQMNHVLCLALCRFVVHSCACKYCVLCTSTNTRSVTVVLWYFPIILIKLFCFLDMDSLSLLW